jgi:hypothetical protein
MANNFDSNITRLLMRKFLKPFESNRVLTRTVDTQLFQGAYNPTSGTTIDVKRPTDYKSVRTAGGDMTGNIGSIITGKATATTQNFFTVALDYANVDEAIKMDQLDELLAPAARRLVTDLETDFAAYMSKNCNLSYGTPGTAVDAWSDVAGAGALMSSLGVPTDKDWYYVMSPGQEVALAPAQSALASGDPGMVNSSWGDATIRNNFAGMRVMRSNALNSRTVTTAADLAGILAADPDVTYVTAKDTMTQAWSVSGFSATATIKAGDIVEVTGKYRVSGSTRLPIFDSAGAQIKFRGVVTADVLLSGGAGTITVAGPGIYEATGAYNTTSAALATNDVVTILGTSGATVQPALFYHPQAFSIATIKIPKLNTWDTVAVTADGIAIRCTKYSNGLTNTQSVRFDLYPAYATLNPFYAGQGFGV